MEAEKKGLDVGATDRPSVGPSEPADAITQRDEPLAEATPRPWEFDLGRWTDEAPVTGFRIRAPDRKRSICDNNMHDRGDGTEPFMPPAELEANARLIVRAVNEREELIAALNAVVVGAEQMSCIIHGFEEKGANLTVFQDRAWERSTGAVVKARALLSKVSG